MSSVACQDEAWDEMLNGKIVLMSPRPVVNHNIVAGNIFHAFKTFLQGKSCMAFSDGVDVFLSKTDRVIPDVMIVCNREIIKQNGIHGAPDLMVEVLSPSTAKNDKGYKKELYAKCGVKEYWIVDTASRSVEVYLLNDGHYALSELLSIYPDYLLENMSNEERSELCTEVKLSLCDGFTIALEDIFDNLF